MDENLLTPSQKKAFGQVLDKCNRCRPLLEILKATGEDTAEEEARLAHLQQMAESALELDLQFSTITKSNKAK